MKKLLGLIMIGLTAILCSCKEDKKIKNTSGIIDCYSIKVTEGSSTAYNGLYQITYVPVYEYLSSNGKYIYMNDNKVNDKIFCVRLYYDRYTSDYDEYYFNQFIGWVNIEYNYYFDIENRVIDAEIKIKEYKYSENPTVEFADNKKAYECAKKSFYRTTGSKYDSSNIMYSFYSDLDTNKIENHTYTKLGENSVVTYKIK